MRNTAKVNKDKILGMDFGTAAHQLRKRVLFALVVQTEQDICFVCGKHIDSVEELSIEHKIPWRSSEEFWDMNNIAFSHRRCNTAHIRKGGFHLRKIGPNGTAWCIRCKDFLPVSAFTKNTRRWNKLQNRCRICIREHRKGRR